MKTTKKNKVPTPTATAKGVSKTHWPVHPIALLFPPKPLEEGKPLAAGDQRDNTAQEVADLAGVGATTIKEAQQLKKEGSSD